MLLIDSQSTVVPATVNVHRLPAFRPLFKHGAYSLRGFDVTRSGPNFKLADNNLLIRSIETKAFHELSETSCEIPLEHFWFWNHDELHGLANSSSQLPGVGKSYTFKVRVTEYNFPAKHQTFASSCIIGENDPPPVHEFGANELPGDHDGDVHVNVPAPAIANELAVDHDGTGPGDVPAPAIALDGTIGNDIPLEVGSSSSEKTLIEPASEMDPTPAKKARAI